MRILTILLFALVVTIAPVANADTVPGSALQLQIVSRQGFAFTVDVTNRSDQTAQFDTVGLYFLPDSTSEEAPQRLGVVTSAQNAAGGGATDFGTVIGLAPHTSVRILLTSYCLDQHRAGPGSTTAYHLAGMRMPAVLSSALVDAAQRTPTDTQGAIWRVRADMPVPLLGDHH